MSDNSADNKRIAKNTIMLYMRMMVLMGISLYTSRLILKSLGVEDFGIYNIVGSIVVLFSFLNNALSGATQRFLNYEIGRGNISKLKKIFSSSILAYLVIILTIFLLCETVGLWFICDKVNIPASRMDAALWVYQISIVTFCIGICHAPYNAVIISQEKMSFYAYLSICEGLIKLAIALSLNYIFSDRLILYALMMCGSSVIILLAYVLYCIRNYPFTKFPIRPNKRSFKEILNFSVWSCYGNLSNVLSTQGLNFILNFFYGVILNAAMGIANQISGIVSNFIMNFQTAANPQIVKLYADTNWKELKKLVFISSKFSFILYYAIAIPLFLYTDTILNFWLVEVPNYAVIFCQITLIDLCFFAVSGPLWTLAQAEGNIKLYMITVGTLNLCSLPLAYVFLQLGMQPYFVIISKVIVDICTYLYRIVYIRNIIFIREYLISVILPIVILLTLSLPLPMFFSSLSNSWGLITLNIVFYWCLTIMLSYWICLNKTERQTVNNMIVSKIRRW